MVTLATVACALSRQKLDYLVLLLHLVCVCVCVCVDEVQLLSIDADPFSTLILNFEFFTFSRR